MLLSAKYKIFAELLGPSLYGSFTVIVALAYYYGVLQEATSATRSLILGQSFLIYIVYIGLLNVRHLHHFILRTLMSYPCTFLISLAKVDRNETTLWQAIYLNVFGLIFTELVFYVQSKAQAKLYMG